MKRLLLLMALILALAGNVLGEETPEASTGFGQPMSGYVETGYTYLQWSSVSGCYHPGSDYNGSGTSGDGDLGWDVLAVAKGKVVDVVNNASFGLCLTIEHKYYDTTVYSQYAHLQSVLVSVNDIVDKGEHVAELGNSGTSCGAGNAHLHWEIRIGGSGKHPDPENADYWNTSSFQSRTNITNWYENPSLWCAKHQPYDDVEDKFDDVVQRNGQSAVGTATNSIHWYGPYLRKDFSGGTFGSCCILYDPYNEVDNPDATDEAYLLRTGFYVHYFDGDGNRWEEFGCPSRDEYHPETGAYGDAIQFFVKRVWLVDEGEYHDVGKWETQFHYMYFEANLPTNEPPDEVISWHSVYETDYVSQTPAGQFTVQQGETKTFTVSFRNESQFTWHNNPSSYPYDYVELKSCDASGTVMGSFLYDNSWLNVEAPCTMQESSIAPGSVATFTFTGKVAPDAPLGLKNVYFRPNHSVGGLISDWGGMHFQVNVVEPDLSGEGFIAFAGFFNLDNKADVGLWEKGTGDVYVALRDPNSNRFIFDTDPWLEGFGDPDVDQLLVGEYSGDGYDDLCRYRASSGSWYVAYNQYGGTGGFVDDGCWLSGWATAGIGGSNDWMPLTADYSGDGYDDLCVFKPALGRWVVAYNWDGYFAQATGVWLDDWGDGSYGTYWPYTGTLNTGSKQDVGCYHPATGKWFVASSNYPTPSFTSQGEWLSGWAQGSSTAWKYLIGKSSSDSYDDIIVYSPTYGRWFVAYNWNGYFANANGADYNNSWLDGWAIEDGSLHWQVFAKDVTGDGYVDLIVYTPQYGRWFVAYNNAGPPPFFNPTNGTDYNNSWLDGWGIETGGSGKLAGNDEQETTPTSFALNQNYPNPFNPATTISYSLPSATHVTLDIFNILGQKVQTLVDEHQSAGEHTVLWESTGYASGIYLYRLSTPEAVETSKMILLK